jgi:hypothetical protein
MLGQAWNATSMIDVAVALLLKIAEAHSSGNADDDDFPTKNVAEPHKCGPTCSQNPRQGI